MFPGLSAQQSRVDQVSQILCQRKDILIIHDIEGIQKANTTEERVVIDLEPLPNELVGLGHQYFAGRTSLIFLTREPLTFRLQEGSDGVSIVLTETARSDAAAAALDSMHSPVIDQAVGQQLGEDLLVKLELNMNWTTVSKPVWQPQRPAWCGAPRRSFSALLFGELFSELVSELVSELFSELFSELQ